MAGGKSSATEKARVFLLKQGSQANLDQSQELDHSVFALEGGAQM